MASDQKFWCNTQLQTSQCSLVWTISNFSTNHYNVGEIIESSTFSALYEDKEIFFHLNLYPKGAKKSSEEESLALFLCWESPVPIWCNVTLSILNASKNIVLLQRELSKKLNLVQNDWGYQSFISVKELNNPDRKYLEGDTLTILCKVVLTNSAITTSGKIGSPDIDESCFLENTSLFFNNKSLSDVNLVVMDKQIPAHKIILSAQSPVFRAMFQHDMKETAENLVEINDFSANVVQEMVRYIYTGKVLNLKDVAASLIIAAEKYGIERLKSICEQELYKSITIDNAVEILEKADFLNAQTLKCHTMNFINANMACVTKTDAWKNISLDLKGDLYSALHNFN